MNTEHIKIVILDKIKLYYMKNIQVVILAAGKGTRLGKLTDHNTKCMLNINGKTLIERTLDNIHKVNIKKVIIVVGYMRDNLINFIGNKYKDIKITYVINEEYNTTNNIYSLYLAKNYLLKTDTIVIESDIIFDVNILKKLIQTKNDSVTVVDKYQSWMDGTAVKLHKNIIKKFVSNRNTINKKIKKYYKTVNIYKFSKNFSKNVYVPFLNAYISSTGKNDYYENVLSIINNLNNVNLYALKINNTKWHEIDDIQDKYYAEIKFENNKITKYKLIENRFGGLWRYTDIKDFCYLVNPFFPTKHMYKEFKYNFNNLTLNYPSGLTIQNTLIESMFKININNVLVGNGSAELIKILSKHIKGSTGIVFPTFDEYPNTFNKVIKFINTSNLTYTIQDLYNFSKKCDNLLIINPGNPTGQYISKNDILILLNKLKKDNKVLIYDESFIDFVDEQNASLIDEQILNEYKNLIIIKSISKSYGVPGLRLGVLFSYNTELINKLKLDVPIWNINSYAEFFLQIINKYKHEYINSCNKVISERNYLYNELSKIPYLNTFTSQSNYFMCEIIIDKYTATTFVEDLFYKYNIFIKNMSNKLGFKNKKYIRISVRNRLDNEYLIKSLNKYYI